MKIDLPPFGTQDGVTDPVVYIIYYNRDYLFYVLEGGNLKGRFALYGMMVAVKRARCDEVIVCQEEIESPSGRYGQMIADTTICPTNLAWIIGYLIHRGVLPKRRMTIN